MSYDSPRRTRGRVGRLFDRMATTVTRAAGSGAAFVLAAGAIVARAASGPLFGYSDAWQLLINTGTTIVTFLMVFVIQHTQNIALHLKLNELVASSRLASNRLVSIEDLDENELLVLREHYLKLARLAATAHSLHESHSIDEAEARHRRKHAPSAPAMHA